MKTVIGVRFREVGKIFTMDPGELVFRRGDRLIAETSKGVEYGVVMIGNREVDESSLKEAPQPILRRATEEDEAQDRENRALEQDALKLCRKKIEEHKLDMKLIAAEYTFDRNKILFYFTADGRVDFRELVKDLASVFRVRIELRQVGVRDETKIVGGCGTCGRPLCCASYLTDFVPVSIKMAKEQNLSLNPQKISGVCGRLMCCLKNEADTYAYLNSKLPKKGDTVELPDGMQGEVTEINILRQKIKVLLVLDDDEREIREVPAEDATFICHRKKGQPTQLKKDQAARREKEALAAKERAAEREAVKERKAQRARDLAAGQESEEDGSGAEKRRDRGERFERAERGEKRRDRRKPERRDRAADGAPAGEETAAGEGRESGKQPRQDRSQRKKGSERRDGQERRDNREGREGREGRENRAAQGERSQRRDRPQRSGGAERPADEGAQSEVRTEARSSGENGAQESEEQRTRRRRPRHRGKGRGHGTEGGAPAGEAGGSAPASGQSAAQGGAAGE